MNPRLIQYVADGWSVNIEIRPDSCNPGMYEMRLTASKDGDSRGAVSPETPPERADWALRNLQEIVVNALDMKPDWNRFVGNKPGYVDPPDTSVHIGNTGGRYL